MLTGTGDPPTSAATWPFSGVTGMLGERSGSVLLVHRGVMTARGEEVQISVVPDSGTGELRGIAGELHIDHADGKHLYSLESTLPGM